MENKIILGIVILICVFILTGCFENDVKTSEKDDLWEDGDTKYIKTQNIGGQYNVSILYDQVFYYGEWSNITRIKYQKNGREFIGAYQPVMFDVLNWIKTNTGKNCTVLCWWDYGHMIEGLAERNSVATFASPHLENTIASFNYLNESEKNEYIENGGGWNPKEKLDDIASILTCFNITSNESKEIIEKYNVSYIFTKDYDLIISGIFFQWFDKNTLEYVIDHELTDLARQTMVFQLWKDDYVPYGLDLVYNKELSAGSYLAKMRLFKVII
jgi:asparagine N-glycosylation enzyme membrane subunit Stt3